MSNNSYKLSYFDAKGRAEIARLVFALADKPYDDERIKDWPTRKETMPFRFVPVLEYNGTKISESTSIVRFLGRQFNLYGENEVEAALADMVLQMLSNLFSDLPFFEKDPETKKTKLEEAFSKNITPRFQGFETMMKQRAKKYLVSDKITYADVALLHSVAVFSEFKEDFMKDFPKLKALVKTVENLPNIQKWLKERPKNEF